MVAGHSRDVDLPQFTVPSLMMDQSSIFGKTGAVHGEEFMATSATVFWPRAVGLITRASLIDRFRILQTLVQSIVLLAGLALFTAGDAIAGEAKGHNDDEEVAAVQATVYNYFDGINTKDRARLESAFDTSAQLKSPDGDGAVKVEPIADAIARWMGGEAQSRKGKILALEITDNQVAQVVFDYDGIFVDFLTLFKLDGQWKIVDKSFIPQ